MITHADITSAIVLPVPPEQAWQAVVDWAGQGRWMLATQVRGEHGLGAPVVARTGIGPVGFTDTMIITEWQPPRWCVVRHTGRVVRGAGIFEVAPAAAGSEFRWTERLELPLGAAGRWGWRLARPVAQQGLDYSLRRFARLFAPGGPLSPDARPAPVPPAPPGAPG